MELIATYTTRGNRNPETRREMPGLLELVRHYPSVVDSECSIIVSTIVVDGIRSARQAAKAAGAKCWNF